MFVNPNTDSGIFMMRITKLTAVAIIMISFQPSLVLSYEEQIKLISEQKLIVDGLYNPLPLNEYIASTDWKNALRLTVKPALGPAKIYELFFNASNPKRNGGGADSAGIQLLRIIQTEESLEKYLEYRKRKSELLQEPLSRWDNSEKRDRKELDEILKEADKKCPSPTEITIEKISTLIYDQELKNEIIKMEKNFRSFPDYTNLSGLRDGYTYIIEIYRLDHYYYFLRFHDYKSTSKEFVDIFLNIINRIESEKQINR